MYFLVLFRDLTKKKKQKKTSVESQKNQTGPNLQEKIKEKLKMAESMAAPRRCLSVFPERKDFRDARGIAHNNNFKGIIMPVSRCYLTML